jgi:eukaryotic-like serine/threonine-protein kinase
MGTPAYMPPEQAAGEPLDARADVYALGAILYHVLGGRPPFVGKTSDDVLIKVLEKQPTPVAELAEGIPTDLTTIVAKAMARDPAARYASARELAADLKRFQTGQLVGAHAYSRWALFNRWLRRHRAAVTVGAFSVVALAAIAVISVRNIVRERDRAEAATKEEERQRIAATAAKDEAVLASARLHFDQGRQELLAGNPLRAAVLARAALVEDTPATRLLAGLALAPLSSLQRRFEPLDEPILASGFTSDGASVFAATWPGRIRLWDAKTGKRTVSFDRGQRLTAAGISPDAATLLVIGDDAEIEVWDLRSGKQRGTISVPGSAASRADFSRDGSVIAVIGDALTIWRTDTLEQIATGPALDGDLMNILRWGSDGKSVALGGGAHGTIAIVDTARWKTRVTVKAPATEIRDLAFSPDAKRLAYVTATSGAILDARTGNQLVVLDAPDQQHANQYVGIEFNFDGTSLAVSTHSDHAKLIDASTGKTKRVLSGYASARFSGDGTKLLSYGSAAGKVGLWDVATGTVFDELAGHARAIADAMFGPDDTTVLTASEDGSLALWTVARSKAESRIKLRQPARSVVFSANRVWMITAGDDGTVDLYDARSGLFARTLGTHLDVPADPIIALADNTRVLTVLGTGHVAELWDIATGTRLAGFDAKSPILTATVVGGNRVITATHTQVAVWDAASGKQLASFEHPEPEDDPPTLPGHQAAATATADGQRILVPAKGGVAVLDVATKAQRGLLAVEGDVWSTVASPAGERAVVIGENGATLFNLQTFKPVASISAQGELVEEVVFAEDGRDLFARGTDSAIRRWDAATGALEATSVIDDGVDLQLFAVQHGGVLLATRANNVVRVWDTRTGKLLVERDIALDANGMGTLLAFTHDGRVVASGHSGTMWTWTLPTWTDTPEALDTILVRDVPWTLVDGTLKPRSLE